MADKNSTVTIAVPPPPNNTNKGKPSNLKKRQFASNNNNKATENDGKTTKNVTNVKFAFEVNDNVDEDDNDEIDNNGDEAPDTTNALQQQQEELPHNNNEMVDESTPLITLETSNDSNGNYDVLPLIRIEEFGNGNNENEIDCPNQNHHLAFNAKSSESIPFIDESPRRTGMTTINYHESRYITINAQNVGSTATSSGLYIDSGNVMHEHHQQRQHLAAVQQNIIPKREQFDKSAQILYQSQMELPIAHHFQVIVDHSDVKLCQVCHEFLLLPNAVKCLTCGFVCHENCVATKVS